MQPDSTQPEDEQAQAEIEARLVSLLSKRDEAIEGRVASGIERQWREDQKARDGVDVTIRPTDMVDIATGEAWKAPSANIGPKRSKVIVNIIRGKCETAEGRFAEIVLPVDDRNWGMVPTPIPETANSAMGMLARQPQAGISAPMAQPGMSTVIPARSGMAPLGPQSQPANDVDQKKEDAKKRAALMEQEIDDQLNECSFNGECRKAQSQAVVLGTGILKGPSVVKSTRKAWIPRSDGQTTVHELQTVEKLSPASKWVDCWNVYPDPNCGNDAKKGAFIWERDYMLPREVNALIGVPGYSKNQLSKVLLEEPVRTTVEPDKGNIQRKQTIKTGKGQPYERWEYHGDVDRADLEMMGCTCPEGVNLVSACVVFLNDRPVKAQLNTLDTGDLPYDFFQWVPQEDSPWGTGEPRKLMWDQRIITAAWRMMMDNAGASAGRQIIMGKDVVPEDGNWAFSNGDKIWIDNREDSNVNNAFGQFQLNNNQKQYEAIIQLALKFTDLESGIPALAQGEKGSAPETLGGMQLLMQGADVVRRLQVKRWDDQVTRPHISRYYHWNMQYNPKEEIKGDMDVDARGTSVLLVKDQTAQSLLQLFQLKADPDVSLRVDWGKVVKQLFEARHLDVLKPEDEYKADLDKASQQPPPAAPAVEAARIRADSAKELLTIEQQFDGQEQERDRQAKIFIAEISNASKEAVSLSDLKARLADVAMKLRTQRDLSAQDIAHQQDVAVTGHMVDLHKHKTQILTPPTEIPGRAPPGKAFQR